METDDVMPSRKKEERERERGPWKTVGPVGYESTDAITEDRKKERREKLHCIQSQNIPSAAQRITTERGSVV